MKSEATIAKKVEMRLPKPHFSVPVLTKPVRDVWMDIAQDMPPWFWDVEMAAAIRALTNEDVHPWFWCLAAFMFEFEQQSRPGAKRSMNFYGTPTYRHAIYPWVAADRQAVMAWRQQWLGQGACVGDNELTLVPIKNGKQVGEPFDLSPVWERACARVRDDLQRVMNAAIMAGDNTFFQRWGEACDVVATHCFGAYTLKGRFTWCDGKIIGDVRWQKPDDEGKPQAHSALIIEICTARLSHLMANGRISTDTETAEIIIQMRRQKGQMDKAYLDDPKSYKKRLAAEVRTYCARLGFTRVVIEKRRAKGGQTKDG